MIAFLFALAAVICAAGFKATRGTPDTAARNMLGIGTVAFAVLAFVVIL